MENTNIKSIPAQHTAILNKDMSAPKQKKPWSYRSTIRLLNFQINYTILDLLYSVHQCARFVANPMVGQEQITKSICSYLFGTLKQGLNLSLDLSKGIEYFVGADFAGNWQPEDTDDRNNLLSRTGFVIFFWRCPVTWISKLQTEVALLTNKTEHID